MAARGVAAALGTAWGSALLARPDALVGLVAGRPSGDTERSVAKVLGARQVAQAAAVARWPRRVGRLAAAADLLHAATMVALAIGSPRYRRVAVASGGVAVLLAVLELQGGRS